MPGHPRWRFWHFIFSKEFYCIARNNSAAPGRATRTLPGTGAIYAVTTVPVTPLSASLAQASDVIMALR
ncbi:hypothetical protein Cocul_01703 [Corynebacterium oculi]|uniref:Uncharacterized protein n=1 Tax=Corynebacterium oculi TaxID=1544416 RepID=A0A0Q0TXB6_9CORY|nr:hypothetical protein Cocul_01703 [Corynebacterium oculi]